MMITFTLPCAGIVFARGCVRLRDEEELYEAAVLDLERYRRHEF